MKSAQQNSLQSFLKFFRFVFQKTLSMTVGGIAHQHVNLTGFGQGLLNEMLAAAPLENIGFDRETLTPGAADFLGGILQMLATGPVIHYDVGSVTGQFQSAAETDSGCPSCDDGCFSGQAHSVIPLTK